MNLDTIFQDVEKKFVIRRDVDFDDLDIHITLQTPSTDEELKITEACSDFDGASYIDQLKTHSVAMSIRRINTVEFKTDEVEYDDENGEKQKKSRFLFLLEKVKKWPGPIKEKLFEIYTNMHEELEDKINKSAKFEHFQVASAPAEEEKDESEFREVKEAPAG